MNTLLAVAFALAMLVQGAPPPSRAAAVQNNRPGTLPSAPLVRAAVPVEPGFVIGPEDVLGILFWRDQDMSGDVTVRPDGMITLPLIRDVRAAGLTPGQLADGIQEAVREYITDASVTVVVRQINSRKVFITGEVARPGAYALARSMTVLQVIAVAGGLTEFADPRSIVIMRAEDGIRRRFGFDYKDVSRGLRHEQNIELKPGDTIVVPER